MTHPMVGAGMRPAYGYGSAYPSSYGYGQGYGRGFSSAGYGAMGSYSAGFGSPGDGPIENRFIQLAEESSLPAFQAIGSVVHAFGSISMMLESSFHAVHSSFQAVLGVAEHFSKMKLQLSQVFSAIAAIRFIKYLYTKFLFLFGLATNNPAFSESVWRSANLGGEMADFLTEGDLKPTTRWPILMYLGLVFAAPYLIWRLLSSLVPASPDNDGWAKGEGEHYVAKALHGFTSEQSGEVDLQAGEMVRLAPRHLQPRVRGWLLASSNTGQGLVPANYLQILGRREADPQRRRQGMAQRPDLVSHEEEEGGGGNFDGRNFDGRNFGERASLEEAAGSSLADQFLNSSSSS